jgi:diaminopimelate decarboxylase
MAKFVVNKNKIKENVVNLKKAFINRDLDFQLFYSVKTNYSKPILEAIKESDSEYEILSDFEWQLVKPFKPKAIVINGPAKSINLVEDILKNVDILYFNIDNDTDFEIIKDIKQSLRENFKIGLRVYLNADGIWNRFGYDISSQIFLDKIKELNQPLAGIHFHFSTNNFKISNYEFLLNKIKDFIGEEKINLEYLDIGGGLPASNEFIYKQEIYEKLPSLVLSIFPNIKIISEAGRNIVADAVYLETEVISQKRVGDDKFQVNIDTNIMQVPCIYEKKFWVEYKSGKKNKNKETEIEIYGNSCMQIDKFADSVLNNQEPTVGDIVVIHNIGAYSYSQAANFITLVPEVKTYE